MLRAKASSSKRKVKLEEADMPNLTIGVEKQRPEVNHEGTAPFYLCTVPPYVSPLPKAPSKMPDKWRFLGLP